MDMSRMKLSGRTCRTIAVVLVTMATFASSAAHSQASPADELVWHWFGSCRDARDERTMTVEVLFGGKRLFASSFPICTVHRSDTQTEPRHDNLRFFFKAPARIFGKEFASLGTPEIEGNIWEAGKEREQILLGVSFMTKNRILLNTIHIASAKDASQTGVAERLLIKSVVKTSPVTK